MTKSVTHAFTLYTLDIPTEADLTEAKLSGSGLKRYLTKKVEDWKRSEAGKWICKRTVTPIEVRTATKLHVWGIECEIVAYLTEEDYIMWRLKF